MGDEYEEQSSEGGGLRRQLEQVLQEKKTLEQSLQTQLQEAETRGAQQAVRRFQARETFGTLGFPKVADLWVKEHPEGEPTPEAAGEFLTGLGITPSPPAETPAPEQVTSEVKQAAAAFQQPVPAGAGETLYTREEFDAMMRDPERRAEALRAANTGRVSLNNPEARKVEGLLRLGPPQ